MKGCETMLYIYQLQTKKEHFHDITKQVRDAVTASGVGEGTCTVFCPHTTAAITINENADPDVVNDLLLGLDKAFPNRREFRHVEGNSSAHLKASCVGVSETLVINQEQLLLGTWQGIYFCEFDGPRNRTFYVKILQ